MKLTANKASNDVVNFQLVEVGADVNILANGNLIAFFAVRHGKILLELCDISHLGELPTLFNLEGKFILART
jgi:hypothetical protein